MPTGNSDPANHKQPESPSAEKLRRIRDSRIHTPEKVGKKLRTIPGDKNDRPHADEDDSREAMHRGFLGDVKERFESDEPQRGDSGYAEDQPSQKNNEKENS